MSRLEISNPGELAQQIASLVTRAAADRHRALLIVETPPKGYLQACARFFDAQFLAPEDTADRADRITGMLGQEFGILIHETRDPVDIGLLAALTGTVRAGGVLILGLPFWLEPTDHSSPRQVSNRFQQRLSRLLLQSMRMHPDKIGIMRGDDICPSASCVPDARYPFVDEGSITSHLPVLPKLQTGSFDQTAEAEQDELLQAAVSHLQRHSLGCMTITGRRGRGKSALTGRIASWLQQQGISVAMTAARRTALRSVERQGVNIPFLAAAEANHSGCRVLLVDEAASLPIDTLTQYLQHHDHVIYCTTIEGYEQAGRAFDIRFAAILGQQRRHVLALRPCKSWRWAQGDPVEEFMDTLLLTGRTATDESSKDIAGKQDKPSCNPLTIADKPCQTDQEECFHIRRLDRGELVHNESLLAEIFCLLRNSHYQTTASDLSHLLDGPDLQIWVLEENQQVSAALLLAIEGGLEKSLHEPILSRQRRLPHQLLPQLLAQSANQPTPLEAHMARVIRIAVTADKRRRGLGSCLLQEVTNTLVQPAGKLAALGASFAGDSSSLQFWIANGFTLFHTGFRRNPRTGTQAVAVLKAGESAMDGALQEAARIHDDNQKWLRGATSNNMDEDPADKALLRRFANAQRSLMDTYAALSRLAMHHPLFLKTPAGTTQRQHEAKLRACVALILSSEAQHFRSSS